MEQVRRFGHFVLYRRVGCDPLGETYRAGRLASGAIERLVLLRLYNGAELEDERLWQAASERRPLLDAIKSPHLAERVEIGREEGVFWTASSYLAGTSLFDLIRESRERPFPIPPEQALFIVERVAVGLTAALKALPEARRLTHGFLVPHLIRLSWDGDVRVTGLETAPGLLALSPDGAPRRLLAHYLAPELAGGAAPEPCDDVYSLGSILLELLSLEPPPADLAQLEARTEQAAGAFNEGDSAEDLRALLRRALSPRADRHADAAELQRELTGLLYEGPTQPSTFSLAFFLHSAFAAEIERERSVEDAPLQPEMAAVRPMPVAPAPSAPDPATAGRRPVPLETPAAPLRTPPAEPPAAAARSAPAEPRPVPVPTPPTAPEAAPAEPRPVPVRTPLAAPQPTLAEPRPAPVRTPHAAPKPPLAEPRPLPVRTPPPGRPVAKSKRPPASRRRLRVGLAALLALAVGLGVAYSLGLRPPGMRSELQSGSPEPATSVVTQETVEASSALPTPVPVEPDPAAPGPAELEGQLRELVEQRAETIEASLKDEYDQRLRSLRQQVADARLAARRPPASAPPASTPAAPARQTDPLPPVSDQPASRSADRKPALAASRPELPAPEATLPPPRPAADRVGPSSPPQEAASLPGGATAPAAPAPAPVVPEPKSEPRPEPQTVPAPAPAPVPAPVPAAVSEPEETSLVAPVVTAPVLLRPPRPLYPPAARKFARSATVSLRLLVDVEGRVREVERVGPAAGLGFDTAAVNAARSTRWRPASEDGAPVEAWVELAIRFEP